MEVLNEFLILFRPHSLLLIIFSLLRKGWHSAMHLQRTDMITVKRTPMFNTINSTELIYSVYNILIPSHQLLTWGWRAFIPLSLRTLSIWLLLNFSLVNELLSQRGNEIKVISLSLRSKLYHRSSSRRRRTSAKLLSNDWISPANSISSSVAAFPLLSGCGLISLSKNFFLE